MSDPGREPAPAVAAFDAGAPAFVLRYRLSTADYFAYLKAYRLTAIERLARIPRLLGLIALAAWFGIATWHAVETAHGGVTAGVGYTLTIVAYAIAIVIVDRVTLAPLLYRSVFEGLGLGHGETTLVAGETGVAVTSAATSSLIRWDRLRLVERGSVLALMHSRLAGVAVPVRAFRDDAERRRFVAFVTAKTSQSA